MGFDVSAASQVSGSYKLQHEDPQGNDAPRPLIHIQPHTYMSLASSGLFAAAVAGFVLFGAPISCALMYLL